MMHMSMKSYYSYEHIKIIIIIDVILTIDIVLTISRLLLSLLIIIYIYF